MQVEPVPSPERKSPPWSMKSFIWGLSGGEASLHASPGKEGVGEEKRRGGRGEEGVDRKGRGRGRAYDAVKFGAFVALWSAEVVFGFAGAELTEVLGGFGDDVFEELECNAA